MAGRKKCRLNKANFGAALIVSWLFALSTEVAAQCAYCDSLHLLFESAEYQEAHGLMVVNRGKVPCNCPLMEARLWLAAGFLSQAKASALSISDQRDAPAGDSLLARIEELLQQPFDGTSLLELSTEYSNIRNDIPAGMVDNHLQVMSDSLWLTTNFPRRAEVQSRYWPWTNDSISTNIRKLLQSENLDYVGRFAVYNDKWLLLTCVQRAPFSKTIKTGRYAIKAFDIETGAERAELSLSAPECDFVQPAIKGNQIFFASNCAGTLGGFDLWSSVIVNSVLGDYVNLGGNINSAWNEGYPQFMGDSIYFTSDRADRGFGGKDIYFAKDLTRQARNAGAGLNSPYDEFAFLHIEPNKAALASTRPGGKGGADIYNYKINGGTFFPALIGRLEPKADSLAGKPVLLKDRNTSREYQTVLDSKGYFTFHRVRGMTNYELSFPGVLLAPDATVELFDANGARLMELNNAEDGLFNFELLNPLDYALPSLPNADESILSIDFSGESARGEELQRGLVIFLEDGEGELIGATCTDENGKFAFDKVRPDSRYTIRTDIVDPSLTIHILDKAGNIIQSISPEDGNGYVYVRIGADKDVITITNEVSQQVKFSIEEIFTLPAINYELDQTTLSEGGKNRLLQVAKILVENPEIDIVLSGHTDSRGTAGYNIQLSQKRINSAIAWLKSQGVASDRMAGRGFGETKPLNNCADGVSCSEAEHAINRRTELQFQRREKVSLKSSPGASPP